MHGLVEIEVPPLDVVRIAEPAVDAMVDAVAGEVQRGVEEHAATSDRAAANLIQRDVLLQAPSNGRHFLVAELMVIDRRAGPPGRPRPPADETIRRKVQGIGQPPVLAAQPRRWGRLPICPTHGRLATCPTGRQKLISPSFQSLGQCLTLVVGRSLPAGQNPLRMVQQAQPGRGVGVGRPDPVGQAVQWNLYVDTHDATIIAAERPRSEDP